MANRDLDRAKNSCLLKGNDISDIISFPKAKSKASRKFMVRENENMGRKHDSKKRSDTVLIVLFAGPTGREETSSSDLV